MNDSTIDKIIFCLFNEKDVGLYEENFEKIMGKEAAY
jgi:hypothetical protein